MKYRKCWETSKGPSLSLSPSDYVIVIGCLFAILVVGGFFGYKKYDCDEHIKTYNYYVNLLNQTNRNFLSAIAAGLNGDAAHWQDELRYQQFYVNDHCGIISYTIGNATT
jgi:hypothetical protein